MAAQTIKKIFRFYLDGFRSMTVGKTLWAIILVKLFILFAILKVFFFPDFLAGQSPEERSRSEMCIRDRPFGHERTNPRQITIAYVI